MSQMSLFTKPAPNALVVRKLCRAGAWALVLFAGHFRNGNWAAAASEPSLRDIAQSYEHARAAISSILIEYEIRPERLVGRREFFAKTGMLDPPRSRVTEIIAGDLIYQSMSRSIKRSAPMLAKFGLNPQDRSLNDADFQRLEVEWDVTDATQMEEERLFDGKIIRSLRPRAPGAARNYVISVVKPALYRCIGIFYLDVCGLGPKDPCVSGDELVASRGRLPEMLSAASFSIVASKEAVSGVECLVLDSPGYARLWLDPGMSYAIRKNVVIKDGTVRSISECSKFEEVIPEIWVPREIRMKEHFDDAAPPGEPRAMLEIVMTVTNVEVNQPAVTTVFDRPPEAGSLVTDLRIAPDMGANTSRAVRDGRTIGDGGENSSASKPAAANSGRSGHFDPTPVLTYLQPAEAKDIDKAIADAQKYAKAGEMPPWRQSPDEAAVADAAARQRTAVLLWALCGGALVIALAVAASLLRKKSGGSKRI